MYNTKDEYLIIKSLYIITPKVFEILENTKPGKGGEVQLIDVLLKLIEEEFKYHKLY